MHGALKTLFLIATAPLIAACDAGEAPQEAATAIKVKIVVVTMFERGADAGDAPGEFQLWYERRQLDRVFPFQGEHDLHFNADSSILAIVTGAGTAKAAASVMALGMDPRFDLSKSYWLVAGIAGFDPADASIGSAAWAEYLVDGDLAHEIDAREKPDDWEWGYIARHTKVPFDPDRPEPRGEVFHANGALAEWAYQLTKDTPLPVDEDVLRESAKYVDHPNARKPPFVLRGDNIAALTFWHGEILNAWANAWVKYWSDGDGEFVSSAMEDTGTYQSLTYLDKIGRVDKDRLMVLRTASNFTMPPPGVSAAENLLKENEGYTGVDLAVESAYIVGSVVIDEILDNWAIYKNQVPAAAHDDGSLERSVTQTGTLQSGMISEASGLARSNRSDDMLWVINDGGSPPVLHAVGNDGSDRGSVRLNNAANVDWEDLASFESGGKPWLLVADIGDNDSIRDHVTLYFVEEPRIPQADVVPARQLSFAYPDGPRDAEAVAVDVERQQVLILTKRTVPAVLYAVPLLAPSDRIITARRLGEIAGIPQPGQEDLDRAITNNDWHWQATGMDISKDGQSAVVLSYSAIYEFRRDAGESWFEAMQSTPLRWPLGDIREAEALAFDSSGQCIFVTVENRHAPLFRFAVRRQEPGEKLWCARNTGITQKPGGNYAPDH